MYQRIERESFAKLGTILLFGKASVLTAKLESFMLESGIEQLHDPTRKHINRKLVSELKGSVQIFPNGKRKLLMIPDSVALRNVMVENQILERELAIWKEKLTDLDKM